MISKSKSSSLMRRTYGAGVSEALDGTGRDVTSRGREGRHRGREWEEECFPSERYPTRRLA